MEQAWVAKRRLCLALDALLSARRQLDGSVVFIIPGLSDQYRPAEQFVSPLAPARWFLRGAAVAQRRSQLVAYEEQLEVLG